jgi:predicted metal-dependent phosphotriesterase family hydrolase/SAM-dependent methyltransferase
MPIDGGYRADLAYIHDVGHGALARDAAARLIKELAGLEQAGTVVDIGCGSGILAEAMTEAGYRVLGVDVSEAMLVLARTRAPRAEFRLESFLTTPLPACVAVAAVGEVLCYAFDSANSDRERASWFKRVHASLCPGGVLLFDVASPERVPPSGSHRTFAADADWAVLAEASVEDTSRLLRRRITSFRRVGTLYRRDDEVHRLSLVDPAVVLATVREAGFTAEIIPAYDSVSFPRGVVAFLCRKQRSLPPYIQMKPTPGNERHPRGRPMRENFQRPLAPCRRAVDTSRVIASRGWTRRDVLEALAVGAAAVASPGALFAQAPTYPKGAIIRTILKDYEPEDLAGGATLFHEHLSFPPDFIPRWIRYAAEARAANAGPGPAPAAAPPAAPPPATPSGRYFMQDLDLMVEELAIARREGIGCIVDGGHTDMGRDINFLRQLSVRSGMPIVAGAGFYAQPFYPKEIGSMTEEQIVRALIRQVETDPVGVFGEIGSWDDITRDERKVFRAVGKAHLATNLPIFTHTGIPGKSALEQLDILEDSGVNPDRVVIGHLGNLVDPAVQVHKAICRRGAFVGFDRQGGSGDSLQVPMVMALIEAGFAANLMFSSDFSNAAQLKRNNKDMGYAKTLTVFVPKLKAAGASDDVLRQIMVDNPRRFLAFVPKLKRPA